MKLSANKNFNQWSLRYKMLAITLLTTLSSLLIAYIALIGLELFNSYEQASQQLSISGKTVGRNVRSALVFDDQKFAVQGLEAFSIQDNIMAAALYREDGSLFAQYHRKSSNSETAPSATQVEGTSLQGTDLLFAEKLYLDGDLIGIITLRYDLTAYLQRILWQALLLLLVLILSAGLAYRVWSRLQPYVTQPIFELLTIVQQISEQHDYSVRVPQQTEDELGQLINGFNAMLSQIQDRDRLLDKHSKQLESRVIERTHDLMQEKLNAEAANRTKSEFLATMSHEIRTPMNAILGFSYLTLATELNAKQKENLNNIHHSAKSLLNIINDILDFSKIDVGKMEVDKLPFDLTKIIAHISSIMQVSAEQKGLKFYIKQSQHVPQYIIGDSNRLQQVLINLIGNAIKFTAEGEIIIEIHAKEIDAKQLKLSFSISDTGIGITEEQQKNLFKLFSQVDSSITRQFGGTGLGLAISQKLVNLMGGEIFVESIENKGTTFYFSLPLDKADTPPIKELKNQISDSEAYTMLNACNILLVEDQYINQQVAAAILEQAGINVFIANNGLEAVNIIAEEEHPIDAVLMDLQMPEMSGYEATRSIRFELHKTDLPIIAMTANILAGESNQLYNAGMNDYIPKPIDPAQLYSTLLKWVKPRISSVPKPEHRTMLKTTPAAQTTEAKTDASAGLLPETLAGINVQAGLSRVFNDHALYQRLLLDFLRNKKDIFSDLKSAFVNQNMEQCQQITHTIKGLAGNLGAEELFICSQHLEQELKNGNYKPERLAAFERALNIVMNGLKDLEKMAVLQQKNTPTVRQNSAELQKQFEKMEILLQAGDFEAVSCLQNMEGMLDHRHNTIYKQLEAQAMSFNFNSALETLKSLQAGVASQKEEHSNGSEKNATE